MSRKMVVYEKKKRETSKVILLNISIFAVLFTIFNCYLAYITRDLSVMITIAGGISGAIATAFGFYYKKAERENIAKHNKRIGQEIPMTHEGGYNSYEQF